MSDFRTKLLGLAALGMAMTGLAYGQNGLITCTGFNGTAGNPISNPTLRAEGETELAADLIATTCNSTQNGAVAGAGNTAQPTSGTVYVTMSLPVTSKLLTAVSGITEATLIVYPGPGVPAVDGTGGVQFVQGTVSGTTLTFSGVNFPSAFAIGVANIRVNATGASAPQVTGIINIQYATTLSASGSANFSNQAGPSNVGYILPSLGATTLVGTPPFTSVAYTTCQGNPLSFLTTIPPTASFAVQIKELVAGAFKVQSSVANPGQPGEQGSFAPTAPLPAGVAAGTGTATQATQVNIVLGNIPASATVYLPQSLTQPFPAIATSTVLTLVGSTAVTAPANLVGLVYPPAGAPGSAAVGPVVAFTPTNNTVTATYTTTQSFTVIPNTFVAPVYVIFAANSAVVQGPMTINVVYSPSGALSGPASLVPTFAPNTATPITGSVINSCATTLLFPYVTNQTGFETGIAIVNTTTDNLKTFPTPGSTASPITGACTVNFYPGGTATQPAQYSTPVIGVGTGTTGSVAAATLSTMSGATNFVGYAIASCPFPLAHGFAYIVDNFGTPSGTAEGYLAVVIPNNRGEGDGTSGTGGTNIPGITAQ